MTAHPPNTIIVAAVGYAERGWSVLPMRADKKPCAAWKSMQTTKAAPADVAKWFGRQRTLAGVGVVLGAISGHLAARDFDDADAYTRWAVVFPELAKTLPTVKTKRGYHVYFRSVGVKTKHYSDGELRGEGHYMVLPPSPHPDGVTYEWVVPLPDGNVPEIDPAAAGFTRDWSSAQSPDCATERTEETKETETTKDTDETEDFEAIRRGWCDKTLAAIEDAITRTLPPQNGKRNWWLFSLCRALQGIPALAPLKSKPPRVLKPVVREWYRRALPTIWTKDWATTWGEFAYGWPRVRFPEGCGVLARALEMAEASDPPQWALEYNDPRTRLLASLCRALQSLAGQGEFFLSVRSVSRTVGVDIGTASRWFAAFVADGVLVECVRGSAKTGKATRWRYMAKD